MLQSIKCPVLLQWVPADMFHPWKKWQPLVKFIKNVTVSESKIHPWHADCAKQTYRKFSNQVCGPIVHFLTGQDFNSEPKEAFKAKAKKMVGADGKEVTAMDNIIFAD